METEQVVASPLREKGLRHSLRVVRPLIWWAVLVLVLYGIRTHQRWMERTRLNFSVSLNGRAAVFEARASLDNHPVESGQRLSLGRHTVTITHPKATRFATNWFVWYGENNLGEIALTRSTGELVVSVTPPATLLTIQGTEYAVTLTNSAGLTTTVPTDRYSVTAVYPYGREAGEVTVGGVVPGRLSLAPRVGGVRIASSHAGTTYQLRNQDDRVVESGDLPVSLWALPVGDYRLVAEHHGNRLSESVKIGLGVTNDHRVEFAYGTGVLETEPAGAEVLDADNRRLGMTPLTVAELLAGDRRFTLRLAEYEPVSAILAITANATNTFRTNLLSTRYVRAMQAARRYFGEKDFDRAAEAAGEALKQTPDDPAATSVVREATGLSHLARARYDGGRGDLVTAVKELKVALDFIPDNAEARQLLTRYMERQATLEAELAAREAEARGTEDRGKRIAQLQARFERWSGMSIGGADSIARQELVTTNALKVAGEAIEHALKAGPPAFEKAETDWRFADIFAIHAEQKLPDGCRHCMVMGGKISASECLICFKVIDWQAKRSVSLLGGLLSAQVTTEEDRDGTRAANFQAQAKKAAALVNERIREAIEK